MWSGPWDMSLESAVLLGEEGERTPWARVASRWRRRRRMPAPTHPPPPKTLALSSRTCLHQQHHCIGTPMLGGRESHVKKVQMRGECEDF